MFALPRDSAAQLERLARTFELATVVLTRGSAGSLIYHKGEWSERRPKPMTVVDTVGAGDAFTAGLTMGLLRNLRLSTVHAAAEELAGFCLLPRRRDAVASRDSVLSGEFSWTVKSESTSVMG